MYNLSDELRDLFDSYKGRVKNGLMVAIRYNREYQDEIRGLTLFLPSDATMSERVWNILHDVHEPTLCICGKPKKFLSVDGGYHRSCGDRECIRRLISKGVDKHDFPSITKKMKDTCMKRYGKPSNLCSGTESREKMKRTLMERYGVSNPRLVNKEKKDDAIRKMSKDPKVKEKKRDTLERRRGKDFLKKRMRLALDEKVKKDRALARERLEEMGYALVSYDEASNAYTVKCGKCGNVMHNVSPKSIHMSYRCKTTLCSKCGYAEHFRSGFENDVYDAVKEFYSGDMLQNRKFIGGVECDIIIPGAKVCIECNGLYWHSEVYKDEKFHQKKKFLVEENGYELIYIWEDDWHDAVKHDIILSRLKIKLGCSPRRISARKCRVVELSSAESRAFFSKNHLYGYFPCPINVGLKSGDEVVCAGAFSKSRKMLFHSSNDGWELVRFASAMDTEVVGGFSRVVSHFGKDRRGDRLFSYVDLDWSPIRGSAYEKLGFERVSISEPSYWWYVHGCGYGEFGRRVNRANFMKYKLVREGYDSSLSESEIMHGRGALKVYGTGNALYVKTL